MALIPPQWWGIYLLVDKLWVIVISMMLVWHVDDRCLYSCCNHNMGLIFLNYNWLCNLLRLFWCTRVEIMATVWQRNAFGLESLLYFWPFWGIYFTLPRVCGSLVFAWSLLLHVWRIVDQCICGASWSKSYVPVPLDISLAPSILERFLLCDYYFLVAVVISTIVQSAVEGCCTQFKIKSQC